MWVELPEGIDTSDLLADAVGAGVLFAPGSQFNHDGRAVELPAAQLRHGRRGGPAAGCRAALARVCAIGCGQPRRAARCTSDAGPRGSGRDPGTPERGGTQDGKSQAEERKRRKRRGSQHGRSFEIKVGLAEMLKGGVIMDVTTPDQAKIAEEAGAASP